MRINLHAEVTGARRNVHKKWHLCYYKDMNNETNTKILFTNFKRKWDNIFSSLVVYFIGFWIFCCFKVTSS